MLLYFILLFYPTQQLGWVVEIEIELRLALTLEEL